MNSIRNKIIIIIIFCFFVKMVEDKSIPKNNKFKFSIRNNIFIFYFLFSFLFQFLTPINIPNKLKNIQNILIVLKFHVHINTF